MFTTYYLDFVISWSKIKSTFIYKMESVHTGHIQVKSTILTLLIEIVMLCSKHWSEFSIRASGASQNDKTEQHN